MGTVLTCDYVLCTVLRHIRLGKCLYSTRICLSENDLHLQKHRDLLNEVI